MINLLTCGGFYFCLHVELLQHDMYGVGLKIDNDLSRDMFFRA